MKKNSQHYPNNKKNTLFFRGGQKTYYSETVIINFESNDKKGFIRPQMKDLLAKSIIPTFNPDTKTYTPGFIIPLNIKDDDRHLQKYNRKFQNIKSIHEEQLVIPKPRNKDYCNVCRKYFDDYLEHVTADKHRDSVRANPYFKRIRKLCQKFKKQMHTIDKSEEELEDSHVCQNVELKDKFQQLIS